MFAWFLWPGLPAQADSTQIAAVPGPREAPMLVGTWLPAADLHHSFGNAQTATRLRHPH